MATIYKVDPNNFKLLQVSKITEPFELYGVVSIRPYHSVFDTDLNILKHEYTNYDTFYSDHGRVDSDIHYHDDEELRFIMQGAATFYIYHDGFLYIADCYELELVKLQPNTVHWFDAYGELLVYRFFKNNKSRIAYEPDHIPECLINIKNYIDDNGRRFEI